MSIEVVKPGLLSTFQDLGRHGSQALGLPACGAMDPLAHRIANMLVGNAAEQATLEITLTGPSLRFHRDCVIALAGADLSATLQTAGADAAVELPTLRAVRVTSGTLLAFGRRRAGVRAYLALAGGYGLAPELGSCSTYLRGALGGWQGRALQKGDRLPLPAAAHAVQTQPRDTADALLLGLLRGHADAPVRFIEGPEWALFTDESRQALRTSSYRIGASSDRMGYRLEGPRLALAERAEMLSEPVAFGTVQVPPDGQPIVLMADRQTTGGYPRIAQIATIDLPLLAQRMPGDPLRFEPIALDDAQRLLQRRAQALAQLDLALNPATP